MSKRRNFIFISTRNGGEVLDYLPTAVSIFKGTTAWYKAQCKKAGPKYERKKWMDEFAESCDLDLVTFSNAVSRSSQRRRKSSQRRRKKLPA